MGLDNFQLTPFLVGELYKDSLVAIGDQPVMPEKKDAFDIQFLGKNDRQILILVNDEEVIYLKDDDLNFLIGIISACHLSLSDTAVVNLAKNNRLDYTSMMEKFEPSIILFFDIDPATLGFPLQFPHFQLQSYNKQTYLSAPALSTLAGDKALKTQLWTSLRKLFSI